MDLQDLGILLEDEEKEYQKNITKLCTTIAYLTGVPWEYCKSHYENDEEYFASLDKNRDYRVFRALCNIRTSLMLDYNNTNKAIRFNLQNLDDIDWYKKDIATLNKEDIFIINTRYDVNDYLLLMNKLIAERINNIRSLFPEWIKWEYIKGLFLMPHGQSKNNVIQESIKFSKNRSFYPYTKYIYWDPEDLGNILISDSKFVKVLYEQNNDYFADYSKVKDVKKSVEKSIYDFINESTSVQLVVDCENSDAFKLASVLKQLDTEEIEKIHKIVLYDDIHTTNAWKFLGEMTDVPIEHITVNRVKDDKSLVDINMSVGITKALYAENITSFILLSSDSDFWGVISNLPEASFLVMAEHEKCGIDIQRALEYNGTYYCFMDDFCTGNINDFKNKVLRSALEAEMEPLLGIDTKQLLSDIYQELRLQASETEKKSFYDKVIKRMSLHIDEEGILKIKIPDKF